MKLDQISIETHCFKELQRLRMPEESPLENAALDAVLREEASYMFEIFTDGTPHIPEIGFPQTRVDLIRLNARFNPSNDGMYPASFIDKQLVRYLNPAKRFM